MIEIIELEKGRVSDIKDMWCDLNQWHMQRTTHFKTQCAAARFEKRFSVLFDRDRVAIYVARMDSGLVGYCSATVNQGRGEVDSLYVKPDFRGAGLGGRLCSAAIQWLDDNGAMEINVQVAEGNEEAMVFYEKFGFKLRSHVMRIPG